MSTTFCRYAPDQSLLLPPDVRAWLPEGHLAHHVSDLVDGLDLTAFYAAYARDGRRNAPYEPRMMVKVLLYAYATGVFSSRGIARRLAEDVAFRVLAAGNFPQHRTVCEFRRRHLEDFKALFVEVVRLARELGLASFGKLSIEGTKVRANASKHKAMSYGRMQEEERRLAGEIDALVRAARDADAAEDERFGPDARGDELPSELRRREDRLAAIRAAKERLEAAQRAADDAGGRQPGQDRNLKGGRPYKRGYGEPDEKAQSNFTDPGRAGIMKTSNDGFQQCYNAQVAVDGEHQLVVATEVTANASDQGGLPLLLDEVAETVGEQPDTVLADAGYSNERDLVNLETRGVDGYVSLGREGKTARRGYGDPGDGEPDGAVPRDESHGREAVEAGGLPLLLDEVAETVGEQPDTVLADAGYSNERDLVNLETRGVDGYGWDGRARRRGPATRGSTPRRIAWPRSCRSRRVVRHTPNASGCRRLRTAGSNTCWDSGASACGGWRRCAASGTWCAWR